MGRRDGSRDGWCSDQTVFQTGVHFRLTVRTNYFESVDHPGKDGDMRQNAKWPLLSSPPPRLAGWSSLEAGRVELSSAITPPSTSSTLASAELDVVNHDEAPPLQL